MKVRLRDKWVVISLWKLSLSLVSQGIIKLRRTWWDIYRRRQMVWHRTHLYCLWRILCSVWQGAMRAVLILAARTLKSADIVNNVCCWGPLLFLCSLLQSSVYSLWDEREEASREEKNSTYPVLVLLERHRAKFPDCINGEGPAEINAFSKDKLVKKLALLLHLPVACRHPSLILEMLSSSSFHGGQGGDRHFCDVRLETGARLSSPLQFSAVPVSTAQQSVSAPPCFKFPIFGEGQIHDAAACGLPGSSASPQSATSRAPPPTWHRSKHSVSLYMLSISLFVVCFSLFPSSGCSGLQALLKRADPSSSIWSKFFCYHKQAVTEKAPRQM